MERTGSAEILHLARARQMARNGRGRAIREAANLSTREMARAVGVSHVTVQRWEDGAVVPSPEAALRWLSILEALVAQQDPEVVAS